MSKTLLTIVVFGLAAITAAQSTGPESVADAFVKSWNTHDMKSFERLFTEHAIWVPVAESMDKGRASIVKDLSEAHRTWAGQTSVKHGKITLKSLSPTSAVLFFHADFIVNGKVVPNIQRAIMMVATQKAGRWQIAAGQLTKQHDGA